MEGGWARDLWSWASGGGGGQRLAASALCNLLANHDDNKRLVRD